VADPATTEADPQAAALFLKLKGWVRDSLDKHGDWYKEAEECFAYTAGRSGNFESKQSGGQWPGTSWNDMIASGRQPVEFNRIGPVVDSVCGLEVNNRQDVKYLPRTEGDADVDERLSSLGKWARDEAQAEDEESEMFRDAVICGRGFTDTYIDFAEEPTGKIVIEHFDPLEAGVDPASKKANFVDARYIWRFKDVPADEAQAMFPGLATSALDANWASTIDLKDGGEGNKRDYPEETRSGLKDDRRPKTVRLVQCQWWERDDRFLVAMPGEDQPRELSGEDWKGIQADAEAQGIQAQRIQRRRYYQAILGRSSILDQAEKECFTIRATTGRLDRNKGYHYGVVRPMRDPQMLANKTLSQVLHILNTNAKGGILYETGTFKNGSKAEADWSNPSKSIEVNKGMLEKIKDRAAPQLPPTLVQLQEFSISSIRDVTGVSVEMLGLADREQAASLEYQRRQSAMTILASLFDGLRRYRKLHGKTLLETLKLLPPGVLVRVLIDPRVAAAEYQQAVAQWQVAAQQAQAQGQEPPPQPEPPTAEFMKTTERGQVFDPAAFGLSDDARFDVIVDETPFSPNQKEATWTALQPFIAELPPQAIKIALKYSPLPETVADDLGDAIVEGAGQGGIPPELQQAIQQGQQRIQQLEQENAALKSDQGLQAQKNAIAQQDADTRRMKAEGDLSLEAMQQRIDSLHQTVAHLVALNGQQQKMNGGQNHAD
jgi:hypothetical protein